MLWEELYGPVFNGLLSSTTAVTVITTSTAHTLSAERFFPYLIPDSSRQKDDWWENGKTLLGPLKYRNSHAINFYSGFAEQPLLLKETAGWTTTTRFSKSSPGVLLMVPQCSMVILWRSNTLTAATTDGCTATAATFMLVAAAPPTSIHAQLPTHTVASRSSRSCERKFGG